MTTIVVGVMIIITIMMNTDDGVSMILGIDGEN